MRTANNDEIKEIFAEVDKVVPTDFRERVKLGEKIARGRGLTLYTGKRYGNRIFNPWIRGLGKV